MPLHQPIRFLTHRHRAQIVHRQQQIIGDFFQLLLAGFA